MGGGEGADGLLVAAEDAAARRPQQLLDPLNDASRPLLGVVQSLGATRFLLLPLHTIEKLLKRMCKL